MMCMCECLCREIGIGLKEKPLDSQKLQHMTTVDGCEILHQLVDGLSHYDPIIISLFTSLQYFIFHSSLIIYNL